MFIVYSFIFVIGYMAFIKLLFAAMDDNGMFDIITFGKWSQFKTYLYRRRNKLEYMLGGCARCTAFWWSLPYMVAYYLFMNDLKIWVLGFISTLIWMAIYWAILAMAGLFALTFKSTDNV